MHITNTDTNTKDPGGMRAIQISSHAFVRCRSTPVSSQSSSRDVRNSSKHLGKYRELCASTTGVDIAHRRFTVDRKVVTTNDRRRPTSVRNLSPLGLCYGSTEVSLSRTVSAVVFMFGVDLRGLLAISEYIGFTSNFKGFLSHSPRPSAATKSCNTTKVTFYSPPYAIKFRFGKYGVQ